MIRSKIGPKLEKFTMCYLTIAILIIGATASAAFGEPSVTDRCDWNEWRSLPVQSGGRRKPLDTLARESLRVISNRASITDPDTGEKLDPTAFWLEAFFDWQGWENPQSQSLALTTNWRREYFHLHAADKWDRAPLLRIDFLELRKTLGVAPETAYVSAAQLAEAKIEDPRSEDRIPFPAWAEKLAELEATNKPLTVLEKSWRRPLFRFKTSK
jgi:hypothetical protein